MDLRYLREILDFSFNSLRFSLLGLVLNALLVFWILFSYLPHEMRPYLYLWLAAIIAISGLRYYLAYSYAKESERRSLMEWKRYFFILFVLSTLIWSSGLLFLLFIEDPVPMMMMGLVYVAVAAGGILGLSGFYVATLFFIGFPLILFALILLYKGQELAEEMTVLLMMMLLFATMLAKRMHQKILDVFVANVRFSVEHRIAEQAKNRLSAVFESSPVGIFFFDNHYNIIDANSAFYEIVGLKHGSKKLPKELIEHLDPTQNTEKFIDINDRHIKLLTSPVVMYHDFSGAVGIVTDMTKEKELLHKTQYQAKYDHLTDIPNRSSLFEHIQERLEEIEKEKSAFAVLFVDLDNFKTINDSLGHHVGDSILIEISNRLKNTIRKSDFIARLGGDEFVIIMPHLNPDLEESRRIIERVTQKVHKEISRPIIIDNLNLTLTSSIGVVFVKDPATNPYEIIKQADIAMYQAKKEGKNKTKFYRKEMDTWVKWRLELENAIKNGLKNKEFYLVYQPIVSTATNKTIGLETLLRWNNPKYGKTPIDKVVQIAEESGMILELGEWIFKKALSDFAKLKRSFDLHKIAINVSIKQFNEPAFLDKITSIAQRTMLDFSQIELEITESIFIHDKEHAKETLERLKEHGFRSPSTTLAPATRRCLTSSICHLTPSRSTAASSKTSPTTPTTRR